MVSSHNHQWLTSEFLFQPSLSSTIVTAYPVHHVGPERKVTPKEELEELAESMKEYGLLNPILVRKNGDGTYKIIAGERRWRNAQLAGMKKIIVFVKETTDERQRLESLIENVHRKDLNLIEKGRGLMEIFKAHGIDMRPKELSNIIHKIRMKRHKLRQEEEEIAEIVSKIHVNLMKLERWFDSISVESEIIEDYLRTPKDERKKRRKRDY